MCVECLKMYEHSLKIETADMEIDKLDEHFCDGSSPPHETPHERPIFSQHTLGMMILKWREMYQMSKSCLSD